MGAMSSVKILSTHQRQLSISELKEETILAANSAPTRKFRTINMIAPMVELQTVRQTAGVTFFKRCVSVQSNKRRLDFLLIHLKEL